MGYHTSLYIYTNGTVLTRHTQFFIHLFFLYWGKNKRYHKAQVESWHHSYDMGLYSSFFLFLFPWLIGEYKKVRKIGDIHFASILISAVNFFFSCIPLNPPTRFGHDAADCPVFVAWCKTKLLFHRGCSVFLASHCVRAIIYFFHLKTVHESHFLVFDVHNIPTWPCLALFYFVLFFFSCHLIVFIV